MNINTITAKKLPDRLRQLHKPPNPLYHLGAELGTMLDSPVLGVVGSRKISAYGRRATEDLVADCARNGIVIVSGLALGVDSVAHQATLDAGGRTIAVLPGGIQKIYPASHTGLARRILLTQGAVVSEYEGKSLPMKHQFIERNRIIAGLCDALLVTEAAENSGSLHTARFALELGRNVLAVPGNISSATSAGTNNLIKSGATPITSAQDIFDALGVDISNKAPNATEIYGDNEFETAILAQLASGPAKGSDIISAAGMSPENFQQHLTMLEIKARIKPLGNDTWCIS